MLAGRADASGTNLKKYIETLLEKEVRKLSGKTMNSVRNMLLEVRNAEKLRESDK